MKKQRLNVESLVVIDIDHICDERAFKNDRMEAWVGLNRAPTQVRYAFEGALHLALCDARNSTGLLNYFYRDQ